MQNIVNVCFIVPALINKAPIVLMLSIANYLISQKCKVVFLFFDQDVQVDVPFGVEVRHVKFWGKYDFSEFYVVHSSLLRSDIFFIF